MYVVFTGWLGWVAAGLVVGGVIGWSTISHGDSTLYRMGRVQCPVVEFKENPDFGVYPEIICDGTEVLPMVLNSSSEESVISKNFRYFSRDEIRNISRNLDFVCTKIKRETTAIFQFFRWKVTTLVTAFQYQGCDQAQISVPEVVGSARCLKSNRRCLT